MNGGRSWRKQPLATPDGWQGAALFPEVPRFFGSRRHPGVLPVGLVRGARRAVAFYATPDAGELWRPMAVRRVRLQIIKRSNPFVYYVPTAIAGPATWWVGIARDTIAVTGDAGGHWRVRRAPAGRIVTAIDARRAWPSGSGGLFATDDGPFVAKAHTAVGL
jgi:hypothetical protein